MGSNSSITLDECSNEGSTISASGTLLENNVLCAYVGGIAGYSSGNIKNSTNYVTIQYKGEGAYVGGLVGCAKPSGSFTIENNHNKANVSGATYVGGIFGYYNNTARDTSTITLTVTNLSNTGIIIATGDYVGGIAGYFYAYNSSTYSSSSSITTIKATSITNTGNVSGNYYVGGIFGYAYSDTNGSSLEATNKSNISGKAYVGGIAGSLDNIGMDTCINNGQKVTANGYVTKETERYAYVGGLVGWMYGAVNNCENHANVTSSSNGYYVGGLIGYGRYDGGYTMQNNHNYGAVSGATYVGGLFGRFSNTTSASGDHKMTITNLTNSGKITGSGNYVGGIAGELYVTNTNSYVNNRTMAYMNDFKNTGNIQGDSYVGGIFGKFYGDHKYLLVNLTPSTITNVTSLGIITANSKYSGLCGEYENLVIDM